MKGNILGIFFTILSGVLIALIVVAYGRSDRVGPEFRFSALNLIYDSKTEEKDLIAGINAYDNRDGDMTSRIVVERVVINKDEETAVVYYAVADYSGNVTKQSRVFPADIKDINNDEDPSELIEDVTEIPQFSFGGSQGISGASDSDAAEGESTAAGEEANSDSN